ncbi:MAG: FAD-dependent oxidoreductase [Candidatus Marinimicrobia bacterium]|nr:FAD-dependent oxidoreductase [Candidatus Neomarinimicrobiota bacterium]
MKIAVIGAGVAGLTAAHILSKKHNITLIEKDERIGGHTNTINVKENGKEIGVDTGFIVLNDRNYPHFKKLLENLDIEIRNTDMSFSYYDENDGFNYAGTGISGYFSQKKNLFSPKHYRFLLNVKKYSKIAAKDVENKELLDETLGEYLVRKNFPSEIKDKFMIPMGAAVWSGSRKDILNFPVKMFLRFFDNHGILNLNNAPQWHTVSGGSCTYVRKILDKFNGTLIKGNGVTEIRRRDNLVTLKLEKGEALTFDKAVCASHADQTYRMIKDLTKKEEKILKPWEYSKNVTILHTDRTFMPPTKSAWACWNYVKNKDSNDTDDVSVTYYMNRLQGLKTSKDYFVTLNPSRNVPKDKTIFETIYTHPKYTQTAISTQENIETVNGTNKLYFCGSYCRYGFHEDAVMSAVSVAKQLGCEL